MPTNDKDKLHPFGRQINARAERFAKVLNAGADVSGKRTYEAVQAAQLAECRRNSTPFTKDGDRIIATDKEGDK